ncbi:virulence-associated protein E [Heyndrickxia sporothermodurans]|uniref:virulence-associated E family protein n=1 Tax=Heyndrickxia sporothermodurans TaxID=46224 RepID=UPI000D3C4D82|nr:virulence-associated E family protein [Heyndrickxia sporothermodurans]PTY76690.1 virulence-associated protein E [Heyndrickxia sporothermodurans]
MQFDRQIIISAAGSRKATQWPPQTLYWSDMVERLRTAARGTETLAEYLKLPKSQQDDLKDVGGFVGGTLAGNRRKASNVTGRDIITLDLDNIPAGGTADVLKRLEGLGCAYATYSTRKHEENKPRLRVLVPLSRTATADEYEPLARKLASFIGMSLADPTTFEASRLMYWPSCCSDSQYVFNYGDKPFLDTDGLLATYGDWRNIAEWPEVPGASQTHVRMAAKQGNPLEKRGVVGAFCRQYDIHSAIETFLPGVYTPTDDGSGRYTFVGGSTVGGAVIYEDGLFLYSHHATDPCSGRLVNAFDLVRLHKFGELDDEAKPDTPVNKLPSFVQMSAFALNDTGVGAALNQERYEQAMQDFGSPVGQSGSPATEQDFNWIQKLKISPTTGQPLKSIENAQIALEGDPNLKGRIRMDSFADAVIGIAPFPWAPRDQEEGPFLWTEQDDAGLRSYLEKILGFRVRDLINDALVLCAAKNRFNPVVDYLNSLHWDGVKRLETLFIDYLGAADTPYTRAVTRKSFIAAVARAMNPGCKHDTMPVLTGAQGMGKTTLIQKMGKSWFTNSIESFEGKEAAELLQGVWLVEIGEMSAYNKSDVNTIKGFLSRTEDQYRAAYARKTEKHPRRCVFFGTSNRSDYLKDPTGGRRFLPIDVGIQQPTKSVFHHLDGEVDQLWAEAVMHWRLGESTFLSGELAEEAKRQQESHSEQDPRESLIREFIERKVPLDWQKKDIGARKMYWSGEFGKVDTPTEPRDRVCAAEIWVECLGGEIRFMKRADTIAINDVLEQIGGWKKKKNPFRYGPYGIVKGGYIREN